MSEFGDVLTLVRKRNVELRGQATELLLATSKEPSVAADPVQTIAIARAIAGARIRRWKENYGHGGNDLEATWPLCVEEAQAVVKLLAENKALGDLNSVTVETLKVGQVWAPLAEGLKAREIRGVGFVGIVEPNSSQQVRWSFEGEDNNHFTSASTFVAWIKQNKAKCR